MNTRSQTPDLLKGIAVLFMIQVHLIELFADVEISTSYTGKVLLFLGGPLVAPVFLLFLGYFMISSKKTVPQLFLRGIKIFLLGMILNLALNLNLFISVYNGSLNIEVMPYIFGVDILQSAGISIIIIALLQKLLKKSILISILICVIVTFLGHFLLQYHTDSSLITYVSSFFYGASYWSYFPTFPWIAYPLLGIVFFQLKHLFENKIVLKPSYKIAIITLFVFFLAFTLKYAIATSSELELYYHHGIVFFCWTTFFLLFYFFLINEIEKIAGKSLFLKYFKWLGENVTAFYFIQWVIIGNIATAIYQSISSPSVLALCFIGVLLSSSFLTLIYLNIKKKLSH